MVTSTTTKRKLVLKMSVSLDGFVSGPNGEIDWIFRTSSDDSRQWVVNTIRRAGAHMMGSAPMTTWRRSGPFRTRRSQRR